MHSYVIPSSESVPPGLIYISDNDFVPNAALDTTAVAPLLDCISSISAVTITTVPVSTDSLATNVTAAPDLDVTQLGN